MNVDETFIGWIGSAIGAAWTALGVTGWTLYNKLSAADDQQAKELSDFKTHLASNYHTKSEIKDVVQDLKQEIRNSAQQIKDLIEAKMG